MTQSVEQAPDTRRPVDNLATQLANEVVDFYEQLRRREISKEEASQLTLEYMRGRQRS